MKTLKTTAYHRPQIFPYSIGPIQPIALNGNLTYMRKVTFYDYLKGYVATLTEHKNNIILRFFYTHSLHRPAVAH